MKSWKRFCIAEQSDGLQKSRSKKMLWTAFADPYGQEVLRHWNIRTDYYAVMQLLLGYPREGDEHPTPKVRKDGRILRV